MSHLFFCRETSTSCSELGHGDHKDVFSPLRCSSTSPTEGSTTTPSGASTAPSWSLTGGSSSTPRFIPVIQPSAAPDLSPSSPAAITPMSGRTPISTPRKWAGSLQPCCCPSLTRRWSPDLKRISLSRFTNRPRSKVRGQVS